MKSVIAFWFQIKRQPDNSMPFNGRIEVISSMEEFYALEKRDDFYWTDGIKNYWDKQLKSMLDYFEPTVKVEEVKEEK